MIASDDSGRPSGSPPEDPDRHACRRARSDRIGPLLVLLPVLLLTAAAPIARTPQKIKSILDAGAHAGECSVCHQAHGAGEIAYDHALIGPDDNTLCDGCHREPWAGGSYPGTWTYNGSAHGSSTSARWPGPDPPARLEPDAAGKCLNCHDPHGREDGSGIVPGLQVAREEGLCLACHDGSPASSSVRADVHKAYRHPTLDHSGRHAGPLEEMPADFAAAPVNRRHAECADCHNPHVLRGSTPSRGGRRGGGSSGGDPRRDPLPESLSSDAAWPLLGASRIRVLNGPAGAPPAYTFVPASDTLSAPVAEYQVCFKCHSSWTVQPAGQTDFGRVLNPNNPSYHPVEATGRNLGINPLAFESGWSSTSYTRCGDCHGSDLGARGPHGSNHRYLLIRPYLASAAPRTMDSNELCFTCHSWDVYASPTAPEAMRAASRFNAPGAGKGHAEHVGDEQVPCYACHVTHGSTTQPHLIATGRAPGIVSYAPTPTGGTCMATCHESRSYTANYGR